MNVTILAFEGFDELDVVGPYRVFKGAENEGADLSVSIRTLEAVDSVTASNGLQVVPDGTLDEIEPDLLVVPGGGWNARDDRGAWAEAERGDIPDVIADYHEKGVTVAGVCTGGMLMVRAGIVGDRPAVTHGGALDDLRESGADVTDARVVDDGDLITAGGVTSGIDLALHVVAREFGDEIANAVSTTLEYEPRGPVVDAAQ